MEDQRAFEFWYENEVRSGRDPSKNGACPINISKPSYPFLPYPFFCGCAMPTEPEHKTDCYFFHEEHQMGATIPTCSYYHGGLGNCPCKDCKKYISKSEAYKMVLEKVNKTNPNDYKNDQ